MSILWLIYWLAFVIVVCAGVLIAYLERETLNIKYAVVGTFTTALFALIPVLNIIASALIFGFAVNQILEDDSPKSWYNKPLFPKKDPNK